MLFLCQMQSSLFSTCQTISEVGVETGNLFCFHASLVEFQISNCWCGLPVCSFCGFLSVESQFESASW